ncbi:MAG TPA: hypothetical protein DCZ94_11990 [Lentisphaeria bacterium]|nr:MAG: hypothetical protein A2X48_09415 [Lentisphaerae bacterium GWF2_49_21]HBC87669.1 hypothetical protein [Lentisphaeria bacterium]
MPSRSRNITFDERAFKVDGQRKLLVSGEIHYARSPRELWPVLLDNAKDLGLNCIASYVFWNWHEPERDVYDFSGDRDLGHFLSLCAERDLDVILRAGPYCCAEWNYGGYPPYLRDEPGIEIRTWNEPYMRRVEKYFSHLVSEFRPYLAGNGSTIILVQVENEYANVAKRYGDDGQRYIAWMGELAKKLGVDVPIIMCEGGAEGAIETVNGFSISEERMQQFRKAHPGMPIIWTELWPSWYDTWGFQRHYRDPRNIASHILSFIANGGSGFNYYMFHGGTNFGRTSMYLQTTSYDFDALLDEHGSPALKGRYLARLHRVLVENAGIILDGNCEVRSYAEGDITSTWSKADRSITITCRKSPFQATVKDEKGSVLFDTEDYYSVILSSHRPSKWKSLPAPSDWQSWAEPRPCERMDDAISSPGPLEQLSLTHDKSDYCWYSSEIKLERTGEHVLELTHCADVMSVFIDGRPAGYSQAPFLENRGPTSISKASKSAGEKVNMLESSEGKYSQSFTFRSTKGHHRLDILSSAIGMVKGDWMLGASMNTECKGIWGKVVCDGRPVGKWEMRPFLAGEKLNLTVFKESVKWRKASQVRNEPCAWYRAKVSITKQILGSKADFRLDAEGLGKGMLFINGHALGRYWLIEANGYGADEAWQDMKREGLSLGPSGEPTQRYYHVPKAWLHEVNELLIFEERECNPGKVRIEMMKV